MEKNQREGNRVVTDQGLKTAELARICDIKPGREERNPGYGGEYCLQHHRAKTSFCQAVLFCTIPVKGGLYLVGLR